MAHGNTKDAAIDSKRRAEFINYIDLHGANAQQLLRHLIIQSATRNVVKNTSRYQGEILEVIRDKRRFSYNQFTELEGYTNSRVNIRYKVWVENPMSMLFGASIPSGNSQNSRKIRNILPDFICNESLTDLNVGDKVWVGFNNTDDIYSGYIMDRFSAVSNQLAGSSDIASSEEGSEDRLLSLFQNFSPREPANTTENIFNLRQAIRKNKVENFNARQNHQFYKFLLPRVFYKYDPKHNVITSGYGARFFTDNNPNTNLPSEQKPQNHAGVDLADDRGCRPVTAIASGKVVRANFTKILSDKMENANGIRIYHGKGIATSYGHLAFLTVKLNDNVKAGQIIGYQGVSGVPGGTEGRGMHLHLNYYLVNPNAPGSDSFINKKHVNPATLLEDFKKYGFQTYEELPENEKVFIDFFNEEIFKKYEQKAKEYDIYLSELRAGKNIKTILNPLINIPATTELNIPTVNQPRSTPIIVEPGAGVNQQEIGTVRVSED